MTGLSTEIYQDFKGGMGGLINIFNEQLLPAISKGTVLTKDYILDLFGRYIQYAIAMDIFYIIISITIIIVYIRFTKTVNEYDKTLHVSSRGLPPFLYHFIVGIFSIISLFTIISSTKYLLQSIIIPEITIYEKIVELKK